LATTLIISLTVLEWRY